MQWPLSAESGQWLLTRETEVHGGRVLRDFHAPEHALAYLSFLIGDAYGMALLRSAASETLCNRVSQMTDHQVVEAIAWELTNGNLKLAERMLPVHAASPIRETEEPEPEGDDWPAPVPAVPRPPRPERPAEFGPQARTLIEAAQTGVPFCEECAAAAAQQAA